MGLEQQLVEALIIADNLKNCIGEDNESDLGSGRIPATGGTTGTWGLMSMIGGISVLNNSEVKEGVQLEICDTKELKIEGRSLVRKVISGLVAKEDPRSTEEGFGGTYFFKDENKKDIAIFKPCDEEPLAPLNPKGFVGRSLGDPGLKPTVRVGEAALREVAAYLLDKNKFSKVPATLLVRASHPVFENGSDITELPLKVGSLQEFVPHICDTTEMGTSKFCTRDVQRIGILDIRLFNTDRHAGNILVRRATHTETKGYKDLDHSQFELIPIDHGFCLPEALEPPYFEWQYWPQTRIPFGEEELKYIASINIDEDKALLRREIPVLSEACLRTMEISTTLLKRCAIAGLSLSDIAQVMSRPLVGINEERSELENLCIETRAELDLMLGSQNDIVMRSLWESDSDADVSCETLSKTEDLQFCIDDVKDIDFSDFEGFKSSLVHAASSFSNAMASSANVFAAVEHAMNLKGNEGDGSADSAIVLIGRPVAHRSLSLIPFNNNAKAASKRYYPIQTPRNKVAYPPLVSGGAQDARVDVFSDLDEDQWKIFIEIALSKIDEALSKGRWIRGDSYCLSTSLNLGVSCPRF